MKLIFISQRLRSAASLWCLSLVTFGAIAGDLPSESFQVKEEETQLARRLALRELVEPPYEYSLGAGYRRDDLSWSIAGGGINVASEVRWKKTVIAQLRAAGKVYLGGGWLIRGTYSTGAVKSGSNQDSDYGGNNRTQEYSRSNNTTGGAVRDLSIGLGRRIEMLRSVGEDAIRITPLAGLSIHEQSLTMYDGHQTIPAHGPINGLQNSYATRWKGSWLGLDALFSLTANFSLNSTVEYHWVDYSAEADWNLRSDFAHPVSFRHVARGQGTSIAVGASYRFNRNFLANALLDRQKWNTNPGYDQTNFSTGVVNYYTLNPVSWDSTSLYLSAVYQF